MFRSINVVHIELNKDFDLKKYEYIIQEFE